MTTQILLIGKPHSGKTTFIGQLCSRVEGDGCALRLYKPIENKTPIIDAVRALDNGDEVNATPTDKSTVICLPLQYDDKKIDLDCPDYGGEQVNHIIENREVDGKWADSIKQSQCWLLFIKIPDLNSAFDLSNKTIKPEVLGNESGITEEYSISDQSAFIELLQILLHYKGQNSHFRNTSIKLTVVITCYDDLDSTKTPREELESNLPLLLNFIETNWERSSLKILGLSSLGISLKSTENKLKYQEFGSEKFGYMVKSDGVKDDDITQLILETIR